MNEERLRQLNIEHFQRLLARADLDSRTRATVEGLLTEARRQSVTLAASVDVRRRA
jgi:hypothetical protein